MQDVLAVVGILTGVVGVLVGVVSILYARKQDRATAGHLQLLEEAAQDRQAFFAQEDLQSLREQISASERQIRQQIPEEARSAYVQSRIDQLAAEIGSSYDELRRLEDSLAGKTSDRLSAELRTAIEREYYPLHRRNRIQQRLIVALLLVLVLGAIAPVPLQNLMVVPFLLPALGLAWLLDSTGIFAASFGSLFAISLPLFWLPIFFLLLPRGSGFSRTTRSSSTVVVVFVIGLIGAVSAGIAAGFEISEGGGAVLAIAFWSIATYPLRYLLPETTDVWGGLTQAIRRLRGALS